MFRFIFLFCGLLWLSGCTNANSVSDNAGAIGARAYNASASPGSETKPDITTPPGGRMNPADSPASGSQADLDAAPTSASEPALSPEPEPVITPPDGYSVIWHDEFTGNKVDESKWGYQLGTGTEFGLTQWGNNEQQYYQKQNASVKDGSLFITAKKEKAGGMPYTSARLYTQPNFAFLYGRIEARIKMSAVEGLWPACWMMPAENTYGLWSASGELDIAEQRGRTPGEISGAAHYGAPSPSNIFSVQTYYFPEGESSTDFHVYALDWTPERLEWSVDGNVFFTLDDWYTVDSEGNEMQGTGAPFDHKFYILLNMAVGGNFDGGLTPPDGFKSAEMVVDYVRVYQSQQG